MRFVQHQAIPATITIDDSVGCLPNNVELRTLITVFAGLNGVGKTRLLKHIAVAMGGSARLVSLHELCGWLTRVAEERPDLADAVDEVDPLEVDADLTLDAVKSIVGRNYSAVQWYALDFEESPFSAIVGDDVVPFFVVESGGVAYTMLDMGLGELAAHTLLWTLWYLREQSDLVLLLDEPDAFFPPRSREPLLDHLATVAAARQQAFVLTSHSREVIERALQYPDVLGYLGKNGPQAQLTTSTELVREIVQGVLYPASHVELVAWVEDESAHALATALLGRIDRSVVDRMALYWMKGTSELSALQSRIPRPPGHRNNLEFAFFLDGSETLAEQEAVRWPMIALPGKMSPDEIFRTYVPLALESLASGFRKDAEVVSAMLASVEGLDPHDWTNDLAAGSGVARPQALRALAEAALDSDSGNELLEQCRPSLGESGLQIFRDLR